MKITVVGCGTAAPEPDRVCSCYYVEQGRAKMLFDVGPGSLHHMTRFGIPWQQLTHVVLSHFHNDHIGDIPALFFAWNYGMPEPRSAPLEVVGPKGTQKLLGRLGAAFGVHVTRSPFEVNVTEIGPGDVYQLGAAERVSACHTPHTSNSLALRLDVPGSAFGYTGDTGPSDDVGDFLAGVSLLVSECSLPDDAAMPLHLSPSSLAAMLQRARPARTLVSHVFPQLDRTELPALIQRAGWCGEVAIAADGWSVEL